MTDRAGNVLSPAMAAQNETVVIPIPQIMIAGPRRAFDEAKVGELQESIRTLGLLNPIIVVGPIPQNEKDRVRLVAGLHRLEAAKRLGLASMPCTVLKCAEALRIELAEIDENIIRNNPLPTEHALLTLRRAEIIKELAEQDGTVTQIATPSKQALRRAGQRTGHDLASVRDQARRTGESKDRVRRSMKRGLLGGILDKVRGTSLDKGVELDALVKLPAVEQEELANRAASGEVVSARTLDRKPAPKPTRKPKLSRREQAEADFRAWCDKYRDLEELADMGAQLMALSTALAGSRKISTPAPEPALPTNQKDVS